MLAILVTTLLCFTIGLILAYSARALSVKEDPLTEQINAMLPQTQCGQCNYPGCKPYAAAIRSGAAGINQCPPGGDALVQNLAKLLDRPVLAIDPEFGETKPEAVAFIREAECIGCTLCIHACPVDAIFGAGKFMHTVIASECTGCELCLPACPVDCIDMQAATRQPA